MVDPISDLPDDSSSPWDATSGTGDHQHSVVEWDRLSNAFSTAGYREGLNAGKESDALQQGFDEAFSAVGVPLGRELGNLRGKTSALLSFLTSPIARGLLPEDANTDSLICDARAISNYLGQLTFADIVPHDVEAEEHARQHLEEEMQNGKWEHTEDHARRHLNTTDPIQQEIMSEPRIRQGIEDILSKLTSGKGVVPSKESEKAKIELSETKKQLESMLEKLGFSCSHGDRS